MESKKLAVRLHNLITKYEKRAREAEKSQNMRLADQITVKELLKDKIHREIQGLRVSPSQYTELEQVNPVDIDNISREIVNKLGPY